MVWIKLKAKWNRNGIEDRQHIIREEVYFISMYNKRKVGFEKETEAAEYLKTRGYQILTRNFTCKSGEIDIIGKESSYLVFVEVKYRKNLETGYPGEAVDYRKQQSIIRTAEYYMKKNGISQETPCRFDVVAMVGGNIELIQNAFEL